MNYLVVRDDLGEFDQRTPSFNAWWFADRRGPRRAQCPLSRPVRRGHRSLRRRAVAGETLQGHVHPRPVRADRRLSRHQARFGERFSEKQVLCRVEGQKGQGFLVVLFPYKSDEPRPTIENWQGERGIKIVWKGETHYVLLDTRQHEIDADGIKARAACLVVKVTNAQNFTLGLPDGGQAAFRGQKLEGEGPMEVVVADGKARKSPCTNLMNDRRPSDL